MVLRPQTASTLVVFLLACAALQAQVTVSGRVIDETGAGIVGARVEFRPGDSGLALAASSDLAGNFSLTLPSSGEYAMRAERQGFYLYQGRQSFDSGSSQLTITLNHVQEFADRIDVTYSPPAIDPQQASDHKELHNTEIQAIPYPASQDYRIALPLMNGVVLDNLTQLHFNGGASNQTSYSLDGFNVSDPVTGRLEARLNIDSIQSTDLDSSRFSAENGRGSAGVLDIKTKMGDDRWRFGGTNFIPSIATDGGWHVNSWTPRVEVSGPLAKGRAWFHNGFDVFYTNDTVHGLPRGQNRTSGTNASDLSRFQVNLTPANILTASFLFNLQATSRTGLSVLSPAETTSSHRQTLFMSAVRDQHYFGHGALLEVGFADTRGILRDTPQGTLLYQITPFGYRGNYFVARERHSYRQQWVGNLYLPTLHALGTHQLKFGVDFEREAFHQQSTRHDYEVLRDDNSVARYVTFEGNPFEKRKNFEGAQYIQDHWNLREGLSLEAGVRMEWNEIVRDLETAPRVSIAWAPRSLANTKFSAGWGVYHDAISLLTVAPQQDQVSLSTFYLPGGMVRGPVQTSFQVYDQSLVVPYYQTASVSVERKLPHEFYLKSGYTHRAGNRGFTFTPTTPVTSANFYDGVTYLLTNTRRERYDAVDISLNHTFARQYEWFVGYTRSAVRSNAAVMYELENPVFGPQARGPFPWDAPSRFHMWGWAPLPKRVLPEALRFVTRNTTAAYLVEYRTGFPFNVVDEQGFLVGNPEARRFPDYFNINLAIERHFAAIHYVWALRCGYSNLTNNGNPNVVNNVIGTPQYLTYSRGQARALNVRLRFLGRS